MTARNLYRRRGAASVAALFTSALLLSGCSAAVPAEPGATGTSGGSGTSAPASTPVPAPSGSAAGASADASGTGLKGAAAFQALTAEQQSKVSALAAMDLPTFQKQSRDDQLAYGAFLREIYQEDAIAGATGEGAGNELPAARPVSASDLGEQIVNDQRLKAATARWSARPESGTTAVPADAGNYAKMGPLRVSPLFPTAYAEVTTAPPAAGQPEASGLPDTATMVLDDESNSFLPMDGAWEELSFKILEMHDPAAGAHAQFWFAYTPFTNIHGAKDGVWVLMFKAEESSEKWVPDLSVID